MKRFLVICTVLLFSLGFVALVLFGLIFFVKEYETPKIYESLVNKYCCMYEVDVNFVYATIKAESNFKENRISKKGAEGLMQIMPSTAKYIASKLEDDTENINLLDAEINLKYGIWYISYLNKAFQNERMLVSAAYNAGEGTVRHWINLYSKEGFKVEEIPFLETQNYVRKVLKYFELYRNKYNY